MLYLGIDLHSKQFIGRCRLAFSADGRFLTGSYNEQALLWDLSDAANQGHLALRGHDGPITCLAISPNATSGHGKRRQYGQAMGSCFQRSER